VDVLRIALADDEHDDGVDEHALVLTLIPVSIDEAGVDLAGDVRLEREVQEVGILAGLDGTALVAGRAVRLAEVDILTVRGLLEGRDQLGVGLGRRRIRDEVDLGRAASAGVTAGAATPGSCREERSSGHQEDQP